MRALRKMFEGVPNHPRFCDQHYVTEYRSNNEELVELDLKSDIFRSLTVGLVDTRIPGTGSCGPNVFCAYDWESKILNVTEEMRIHMIKEEKLVEENCVGNLLPASIHGNGGTKIIYEKVMKIFKNKLTS